MRYTTSYARTHLSRLLKLAETGEEVIIMRGSIPIARIIPLNLPESGSPIDLSASPGPKPSKSAQ
jgi:antitoxin (DNA-binding transcriptional repressor) of toxin-antitoxin stability system